MQYEVIDNTYIKRLFWLFLCLHLLSWTLVPATIRLNLPLDAIEGTIWGHQLEWGYDKNPFLNGWLTALATTFAEWPVYLFSQVFVIACFWSVWRIASHMLAPAYALLSVLVLEGIQYYNFHAIDFNDNTLELGLWGLTAYAFYIACRYARLNAWILTGVLVGLSMMAKYYTLALIAGMGLFMLCHADNRKQLRTPLPYIGMLAFGLVVLPHVLWLVQHDFISVRYVFDRAGHQNNLKYHFLFPLHFILQQLQAFLPALLLFLLLFIGKKPRVAEAGTRLSRFDRDFLFYVGLAPFLLTALLSLVFSIKLRAGWGMPLLSMWGIILAANVQPRLSLAKIRNFFLLLSFIMFTLLAGYSMALLSDSTSSANFPGREIARAITQEWHEKYNSPLAYIAGSRWIGGNVGFYSPDHPAVFIEWEQKRAPWINLDELQKKGGVFVWSLTDNEQLPAEIRDRFPQLAEAKIQEFAWQRKDKNSAPLKIGIAILPPARA